VNTAQAILTKPKGFGVAQWLERLRNMWQVTSLNLKVGLFVEQKQ